MPADSALAQAKAAAAAAAKTACAKKKSAKRARIVVEVGDASVTYTFKCSTVAKSASSGTTPTTSASGAATTALVGTANPTFPMGAKGELVVVANGPYSDQMNTVPVVVRNNTGRAVTSVEVQGAARDANGALVGSGSSQGVQPAAISPGGIGIGYVYFRTAPGASQFTFTTSSKPSKGSGNDYFADVTITEHNYSEQQQFGTIQGQLVGTLVNPLQVTITGPISVLAMCFDPNGQPAATISGFGEGNELTAAASTTFSISSYGLSCPSYLVGASGFNQAAPP